MTIRIIPFIINRAENLQPPPVEDLEKEKEGYDPAITYWGIYLDNQQVSYTSSKELAEKTKLWMEKWLREKN